jgi:kynureninase
VHHICDGSKRLEDAGGDFAVRCFYVVLRFSPGSAGRSLGESRRMPQSGQIANAGKPSVLLIGHS